jgi:hypothetical protein
MAGCSGLAQLVAGMVVSLLAEATLVPDEGLRQAARLRRETP